MDGSLTSQRRELLKRAINPVAVLIAVFMFLIWSANSSRAEDDPFEDLRQRIEQLEQDNRELRASLNPNVNRAQERDEPIVPPSPQTQSDVGDDESGSANLREEEQRIGGIVERYLRSRSVDANQMDDLQQQNISALQQSVAGIMDRLNKKTFPTVQVNGVFQSDVGFFSQDENSKLTYGDIQDGAAFRRARLSAKGAISESTNYFLQMDFAFFGRPTFTDVWVEQTQVPILGNVRVGQWKQPFSLEVVSSFRYSTFVERSLLFQAFTPFRHIGTGFYNYNDDQTLTWAASGFAAGQDQYGGSISNSGGWGTAERITYLPYWDDASKGESYLHMGLGHFFSTPPNHVANFRTIPELYIGQNAPGDVGSSGQAAPGRFNGTPFFVQTGNLGVNSFNVIGTEALWVNGPFSLQSETMVNFVDQSPGRHVLGLPTVNFANGNSNAILYGSYAQVGYFLTGEHRPYDRKMGAVDRIIPRRNFGPWREDELAGWGAWELAGRWSYLDLNDKNIRGGTITNYTAGLNWYLNAYWKMQFNYIHSNPDYTVQHAPAGTPPSAFSDSITNMFELRCQADF